MVLKCKYASALGKFEPDEAMMREDQSQSGMSMKLRMQMNRFQ